MLVHLRMAMLLAREAQLFGRLRYTQHIIWKACGWLLSNFEARKAARAGEVESLKNAKAVLAGADYSLVQISRH